MAAATADATSDRNQVLLEGRVSGEPERSPLPSGDEVVSLRLVVRRRSGSVDTLPVTVGRAPPSGTRPRDGQVGRRLLASAVALPVDGRVRVQGRLRRRWWREGDAGRSLIEVQATAIERIEADRGSVAETDG